MKWIQDDTALRRRFFAKIEIGHEGGCWRWIGGHDSGGYGAFTHGGRTVVAHRAAYELLVGPIPPGMTLDHVRDRGCAHRDCVWPAHLEPVPLRVNILRGGGVGVRNAAKTHCPQGHPYDERNTCITRRGFRRCRACGRADQARRKASVSA